MIRPVPRKVPHDAKVMTDEDVGQLLFGPQREQQVEHRDPHRNVQHADGLVGHHQTGLEAHSPGDHQPLPLAARELVRVAAQERRAGLEVDRLEQAEELARKSRRRTRSW